ncbi:MULTISPECIES: transposase [unclassified Caballeronia]|uniref:IS66-like element accessory protein TnpA n=1 Tax=unclassified Caballeronia TaxID=2646786 RepID=UPI001F176FAE|nr:MULTISPECIES: transposase [unclassified Caballeronia]MCE4546451.1 transposase [Caballeronia sp. PC1]MCE4573076.1 transposase [Caballeronia sp. CLC5]
MDNAAQSKRCKRPNFSVEFKRQIVEETLRPGASAALIAREHDINANLLFKWRRHYLAGDFGLPDVSTTEARELNWLPVAVAPPASDAGACSSSGSVSMYEIECGEVRLRLNIDTPIATLVKIVRGLAR